MRIVEPSVEIMRTGMETEFCTPEQFIEKVGRTCYKSEDKITDDSAAKFVGNLVKRGHEAMIEHWNLVFKVEKDIYERIVNDWLALSSKCTNDNRPTRQSRMRFTQTNFGEGDVRYVVSANMRAWRDLVKDLVAEIGFIPQYLHGVVRNYSLFFPEFQDYVPAVIQNDKLIPIYIWELSPMERRTHQNITVKIVCDRGVSHEIVRHRAASYAQESTRYCNYGLDKFGSEITVVRPSWCSIGDDMYKDWFVGCCDSESAYFKMLADGATPQMARSVLPNSLKTEIIVTASLDDWDHFFDLRCDPAAQPDMKEVADMTRMLFDGTEYICCHCMEEEDD